MGADSFDGLEWLRDSCARLKNGVFGWDRWACGAVGYFWGHDDQEEVKAKARRKISCQEEEYIERGIIEIAQIADVIIRHFYKDHIWVVLFWQYTKYFISHLRISRRSTKVLSSYFLKLQSPRVLLTHLKLFFISLSLAITSTGSVFPVTFWISGSYGVLVLLSTGTHNQDILTSTLMNTLCCCKISQH